MDFSAISGSSSLDYPQIPTYHLHFNSHFPGKCGLASPPHNVPSSLLPTKNLWGISDRDLLQVGHPFNHPNDSVEALKDTQSSQP